MKILALEFSSAQRSVAVACGLAHVREVIESGRAPTMRPFAMIEAALGEAGVARAEIETIVVGLGPGSYTGIRAAIAVALGWQLAQPVTLVGVSSVAAVAAQAHADGVRGPVQVAVDAQRGEWYLAGWELDDQGWQETAPLRIVNAEEFARRKAVEKILGPEQLPPVYPRAATLAQLVAQGDAAVRPAPLEPIYLRETAFVKAPPPRAV